MSTETTARPKLPQGLGLSSWEAIIGGIRIHSGPGALSKIGGLVHALGGRRTLIVTDPGVRATGHPERAVEFICDESGETFVFDGVEANPTTLHVQAGTAFAREREVDLIVGFGGGSAMDCAKGINFLLTNGGKMEDYWGVGKARGPMLPSIGVPTTAGTGSEAQSFALIAQEKSHRKMACGDEQARFHQVILDPELTVSAPRPVAVATGIDAIAHAVESYVSTKRTPVSQLYAREAWRLLVASFSTSLIRPKDLQIAAGMQLGAHLAGAAIEGSMLGAAHACANPLTADFELTHGIAVGLMLPHVVRFNAERIGALYEELVPAIKEMMTADDGQILDLAAGGTAVAELVETLVLRGGVPNRLRDHGIEREDLAALAEDAADQWTAGFNPRPVARQELLKIYEAAY
jgi:alcohol dehydrogenase